jgi:hypothetical protein
VTDLFRHRATAVWVLLAAATCLPLALGAAHGAQTATALALVIAFAKVRYIGLEFMELRGAHTLLRGLFEAWVLVVGATVLVLYLAV